MSGERSQDREIVGELQAMIRREEARLIATDVLRRRAAGETISDEQIIAQHIEFMPELAEELRIAREIHQLALAARKAGTSAEGLQILSSDELEAPLGALPGEMEDLAARDEGSPKIEGITLLNEIGRGGQAVVYKAIHESTGRRVAVKILIGGPDIQSEQRARFDREVRTMAALSHPHIVSIIDRGRTNSGAFYLAMELVEGWSFDEFATECTSIDDRHPQMLLSAMVKVARAVDVAHAHGIIHRDLKPSNIRVDRRGEPRVLDFGLAKVDERDHHAITTTGEWVGSLPWFSPEVARTGQKAASAQSDVYGLGVVFYHAISGEFPYDVSGSLPELLRQICECRPRPIANIPSKTGSHIDAILQKAMAKLPEKRYATAGDLADELERVLGGSRPAAVDTIQSRRRRCLVACAAIFIITANVIWWFWPERLAEVTLPAYQNELGMRFVQVPAGSFMMGTPSDDPPASRDETFREVRISKPYWIGTTEVTQSQYARVMGLSSPSSGKGNLPVVLLSRDDATLFCDRLSEREGRRYRLPTEAEWEYACRANGNGVSGRKPLADRAWTSANSKASFQPVGTKAPNDWGLFDMLGNASEWCADGYHLIPPGKATDPFVSPDVSDHGVLRGGDKTMGEGRCRPAVRIKALADRKQIAGGLRVVLSDSPPATSGPLK